MSQFAYTYNDSAEKKLTESLVANTSKLESEFQQLLASYKKRDDDFRQKTEARIQSLNAHIKKETEAMMKEKADWEAEKKKIASTHALEPDVTINVGGNVFRTTMTTLKRFPNTMIGAMFSGRHALHETKEGAIALDRDGTHFRHILNFLRDPENYTVDHLSAAEQTELKREAVYYGLGELMFPFRKAADTTVRTNSGHSVTVSQDDDGIWYMKYAHQQREKVAMCPHCKAGVTALGGHCIAAFGDSRKIFPGQPKKENNRQCPMCYTM